MDASRRRPCAQPMRRALSQIRKDLTSDTSPRSPFPCTSPTARNAAGYLARARPPSSSARSNAIGLPAPPRGAQLHYAPSPAPSRGPQLHPCVAGRSPTSDAARFSSLQWRNDSYWLRTRSSEATVVELSWPRSRRLRPPAPSYIATVRIGSKIWLAPLGFVRGRAGKQGIDGIATDF